MRRHALIAGLGGISSVIAGEYLCNHLTRKWSQKALDMSNQWLDELEKVSDHVLGFTWLSKNADG